MAGRGDTVKSGFQRPRSLPQCLLPHSLTSRCRPVCHCSVGPPCALHDAQRRGEKGRGRGSQSFPRTTATCPKVARKADATAGRVSLLPKTLDTLLPAPLLLYNHGVAPLASIVLPSRTLTTSPKILRHLPACFPWRPCSPPAPPAVSSCSPPAGLAPS